jgi:CubicO group peptidase (beta-lactamase class C family)
MIRMKKNIAFVFFSFFSFPIIFAQQLSSSLDKLLENELKPMNPGITVLIAKKGTVVYEKSFGSANIELNVPMKPQMVFNIGSITKQFTAVAILQLVEQGKISLQDSLQKYVSRFPSKGYKITIEHLLTHTSGIRDYLQINYQEPYMERRDFDPAALIDSFKTFPLQFEPGTKFRYSNSGYFLLGYIIEQVTGKSYQNYLQENIFTPLELFNTYTDDPWAIIPNRVYGYKKREGILEKADYWSATIAYGAGGIISNVKDLYKWHKGLYSYKILNRETLAKAFTSFKLQDGTATGYGYGWFLTSINGIRSIEHGGAITGFRSKEVYSPDEDIFIAVLSNSDNTLSDPLLVKIAGIALGKPLQKSIKISEALLNDYTGTYALSIDSNRTIVISKPDDQLVAKISGQGNYLLLFSTDTRFEFKGVLGASCEFIRENNRVIKFIVSQNGLFEWKKIK